MMRVQAASAQIKGWHVLAVILAFFATIIAVNGGFIFFALNTYPGEDVPHSYLQGLNYNETLAQKQAQARLGWRAQAAIVAAPGRDYVEVRVIDAAGRPVDGLHVDGLLRHPIDRHADIPLAFAAAGDGRYLAPVGAIPAGAWLIRATAIRGGDTFELERRQTWSP